MVPLKEFQRLLGHMASTVAVTPLGLLHMRPPVQFSGRRTLVEFLQHPRQSDWVEKTDARPSTGASSPGFPVSPFTGLGVRMA